MGTSPFNHSATIAGMETGHTRKGSAQSAALSTRCFAELLGVAFPAHHLLADECPLAF